MESVNRKVGIQIGRSIWFGWNPFPECERVVISDAPRFMRGFKAVFAADLHMRDCTGDEYMADIAHMLGSQGADMLLLGGDYGESRRASERFFKLISRQEFPMGIYGVPGNNDVEAFEDIAALRDAFPGELLANRMHEMRLRGGRLMIGGLDELRYGAHPVKSVFPIARDGYSILISHYPKLPAAVSGARPRLVLSGHTHGGQFRIFGLTPYSIGFERGLVDSVSGIAERRGVRLLTSNGIGVSKLPLRIGCPPQVHLIEFV